MNQNLPDPFEKFVVPEGVKKVEFKKDTKVPNAGTFLLQREDHTTGNLIRCMLHRDEHVAFAGYRIPHPLKHEMIIRIQTDGSEQVNYVSQKQEVWSPIRAFKHALNNLEDEVQDLQRQFHAECLRIQEQQGQQQQGYGGGYGMGPDGY